MEAGCTTRTAKGIKGHKDKVLIRLIIRTTMAEIGVAVVVEAKLEGTIITTIVLNVKYVVSLDTLSILAIIGLILPFKLKPQPISLRIKARSLQWWLLHTLLEMNPDF